MRTSLKKIGTVAVLLSLFVASSAFAQGRDRDDAASGSALRTKLKRERRAQSGFRLVPMIGAGSSFFEGYKVNDETSLSIDRRTGVTGGLLVEYGRGLFSGQSGVFFFQEGMEIDQEGIEPIGPGSNVANKFKARMRLSYVGIPLLGKLNLRTPMATYYVKAGVIPAAAVAGELTAVGTSTTDDGVTRDFNSRSTKSGNTRAVNVFGNAAIGVAAPVARGIDVRLETAYNRMLLPVGTGDGPKLFSNSFTVMVGAGFSL